MREMLLFFGVLLLPAVSGQYATTGNRSDAQEIILPDDEPGLSRPGVLSSGVADVSNYTRTAILDTERTKQRRVRVRKWKEKNRKNFRQRNKRRKSPEDLTKYILRNNEKMSLVRNKTIEILKSGLRILSAGENSPKSGNKFAASVNESLLEKILSSAVSKQDVLLSASGAYKLPVGLKTYDARTPLQASHTLVPLSEDFDEQQIKRQSKNQSRGSDENYDYEYDLLTDLHVDVVNESTKVYGNMDYDSFNADEKVGTLLEHIVNALRNLTARPDGSCPRKNETSEQDPCQKWLNCRESLDRAFVGPNNGLPSCPCAYPSSIFYNEMIWDGKQKKYFRWRDASSDAERLDVYKPGAAYCIRSLITQGSSSLSSQQCCYDRSLRLLTRGSGAGTINFISPDVSKKLHYTADILPWRLCKGDFTRYNIARTPNNGNDCPENPDEKQYLLQVKLSKIF